MKKLRPRREITLFSVYNGVLSLSTVSAPPWGSRVAFRWLLEGGLSSSVLEPREGMLGICFLCALEWGGEEGTVLSLGEDSACWLKTPLCLREPGLFLT